MEQANFVVSILLRYEGDGWAAQCLEYDISAQGKTLALAKEAFEKTFIGQILVDVRHGNMPLVGVPQAPREYWEQFQRAERLMDRKPFYIGEQLPPAFMIHAAAEDLRVCA
jgi:hypothetical protein